MADKNSAADDQPEKSTNIPVNVDKKDDAELDDLLDSALDDFDKPTVLHNSETEVVVNSTTNTTTNSTIDAAWSEEFMQQTTEVANFFQNLIGKEPQSMDDFQKFATMFNKPENETSDAELGLLTQEFLSNLSTNAQSFTGQQAAALNDEDLSKMFSSIGLNPPSGGGGGDEATSDMSSMVQNMMQMLLSKDLLYPALRDIADRYPNWLSENKEITDEDQFKKYETQYDITQKICNEFESELESDTTEMKKRRFEVILELMQKMSDCGIPPASLIRDGAPGLELDDNGIPKVPGLSGIGNEKCLVM